MFKLVGLDLNTNSAQRWLLVLAPQMVFCTVCTAPDSATPIAIGYYNHLPFT